MPPNSYSGGRPLRPGQRPTAGEVNALVRAVSEGDRASGTGGTGVSRHLGGLIVRDFTRRGHPARITGAGTGAKYPHVEVVMRGGVWADLPRPPGVEGTADYLPAEEANGRTGVPVGSIVWLEPAPGGTGFVFWYGAGDGPEFCTDTNGSGYVTAVKKVITGADGALRCVPVEACCPVRWYCTSNEWLNLEVGACCPAPDHFEVTRIVLVQFTAKTGASTAELPDAALLVYKAGSLTPALWTGSASGTWNLGDDVVTGGVEFECVAGTLKARWDVTGFTGGADVTAPCLLTASPLDLGTFTYTRTRTYSCGVSVEETGTVDVSVASWIEP